MSDFENDLIIELCPNTGSNPNLAAHSTQLNGDTAVPSLPPEAMLHEGEEQGEFDPRDDCRAKRNHAVTHSTQQLTQRMNHSFQQAATGINIGRQHHQQQQSQHARTLVSPRVANVAGQPSNSVNNRAPPTATYIPPPRQRPTRVPAKWAAANGLLKCESMDDMWYNAGSLQKLDNDEEIMMARGGIAGDCCRISLMFTYVMLTNLRFIVKQKFHIFMFNYRTEEESFHYSDLQHVKIQRGMDPRQFTYFSTFIAFVTLLGFMLEVIASNFLHGIGYALVSSGVVGSMLLAHTIMRHYNMNFLIISISKSACVGIWSRDKGASYVTLKLPLPIDFCFDLANSLIKKHPLTISASDQIV